MSEPPQASKDTSYRWQNGGLYGLSRLVKARPAYGLGGIRRTGGTSWIWASTWNVGIWPVMRSENPISGDHEGGK